MTKRFYVEVQVLSEWRGEVEAGDEVEAQDIARDMAVDAAESGDAEILLCDELPDEDEEDEEDEDEE